VTSRLSLLIGCLLATIACAPKPNAASADITPASRTHFGDLAGVVIADSIEGPRIVHGAQLRYPDAERMQNIEAAFAFAFLIDQAGRPELESVSFIGGAAPAFFTEACHWLQEVRYAPVVRDGVPHRALLVSQLTFGLERVDPARAGQRAHTPNVEKIRRELIAKGLKESVRELEGRRHCP